jgi:hypothetical protein
MKCWIVCEECEDPFYEGHPTGIVFLDEAQAEEYIKSHGRLHSLYLERGYVEQPTTTEV